MKLLSGPQFSILVLAGLMALSPFSVAPVLGNLGEEGSTTPDFSHYYTLEAELADLILERRTIDDQLASERHAITLSARESKSDPREALLVWRSERSDQFIRQEESLRQIFRKVGDMRRLLLEYNGIPEQPPAGASHAEHSQHQELLRQVNFMINETIRHHERQAANDRR